MLTTDGYDNYALFLEYKMLHCSVLFNQTNILLVVHVYASTYAYPHEFYIFALYSLKIKRLCILA
jgi:hypothetical protein